jgi:hypothetical protein
MKKFFTTTIIGATVALTLYFVAGFAIFALIAHTLQEVSK